MNTYQVAAITASFAILTGCASGPIAPSGTEENETATVSVTVKRLVREAYNIAFGNIIRSDEKGRAPSELESLADLVPDYHPGSIPAGWELHPDGFAYVLKGSNTAAICEQLNRHFDNALLGPTLRTGTAGGCVNPGAVAMLLVRF